MGKPGWLVLFAVLFIPLPSVGETIYAAASGGSAWQIFWFDSNAPGEPLGWVDIHGDFDDFLQFRIEFDPRTGELYGFGYPNCQITCPPSPIIPAQIDLSTGQTSFLDWPGFPSFQLILQDIRIDPATREVRAIGTGNFRYSLNDLQLHEDEDLTIVGRYEAISHSPAESSHGGETLAIYYADYYPPPALLARIGGPGGIPPASSGEVTLLGEIAGLHYVSSFDISSLGAAFLLGYSSPFANAHLYQLDLETLQPTDLGEVLAPTPGGFVMGIAAPPELGARIAEVPALSQKMLAAFVVLLMVVARAQLRSRL